MKIIECIPNFSEGRDQATILAIRDAICSVPNIQFLLLESGEETHRTVMTFTGSPEAVTEAAFRAIQTAAERIDMSKHHGTHPRQGATDVCPFVPVSGITMKECAELATKLGKRVGEELQIPVYLYEYSATSEERRNLTFLRMGEYEALPRKLCPEGLLPDFGPQTFNERTAKTGATVIGARDFLIAYNINLNTMNQQLAAEIAEELREKGRIRRFGNIHPYYYKGRILRYNEETSEYPCSLCYFYGNSPDQLQEHSLQAHNFDWQAFMKNKWNIDIHGSLDGVSVKEPGQIKYCKAIGWVIESYHCAQVSMNLTHPDKTPLHQVFEACRESAAIRGLEVTGSEIIGVIPYAYLRDAGLFYLKRRHGSNCPKNPSPAEILDAAIQNLGLNDVAPFDIHQKVLGLPENI